MADSADMMTNYGARLALSGGERNTGTSISPDNVGKLLSGTPEEREKVVGFHGAEESINVLNHAINRAKIDYAESKDEKDRTRLREYHDSVMGYRDELLSRQGY